MFGRLFGFGKKRKDKKNDIGPSDEDYQKFDDSKNRYMELVLGKEADMVMHSVIPYHVGGSLDIYFYPNGVQGTGFATKEMASLDGSSPSNNIFPCYEWVIFTRETFDIEKTEDEATPFGRAFMNANYILNVFARYSEQATLNPNETCEFPSEMEKVGECFVIDSFSNNDELGPEGMGLMLIIEVHRDEMNYARKHGGAKLIALLKERGIYPYSDLDRPSVV